MTSYTPESYYGPIPGSYREGHPRFGLVPWPAHLRPRESSDVELTKKGERYCAANALLDIDLRELFGEGQPPILASADDVFFLTLTRDRASIAYTIERLINMLDAMEDDPDEEPSLGWPSLGAHQLDTTGAYFPGATLGDDREEDTADWEDDADSEPWLGWQDEGAQYHLRTDDHDREPDLGATEEIDQVRRLERQEEWLAEDGEPELGWPENAGVDALAGTDVPC